MRGALYIDQHSAVRTAAGEFVPPGLLLSRIVVVVVVAAAAQLKLSNEVPVVWEPCVAAA